MMALKRWIPWSCLHGQCKKIHFSFPFSLEWSIHAEKRATFYPVCYYNIDYDWQKQFGTYLRRLLSLCCNLHKISHSLRIRFASSLFSFLIELSLFPMIKKNTSPSCGKVYKSHGYFFLQFTFPWFWVSNTTFMKLDWEFVCFFNLRNHWFMLGWLSPTMVFTLSDLKYIWTSLAQAHKKITFMKCNYWKASLNLKIFIRLNFYYIFVLAWYIK